MRHGKKFNHLSRTASHRSAMLSNMASSLIEHKRITTTVAKAKELRKYVEPLLTKAKTNTTHSRRVVFSYLQSKTAVTTLFDDVAAKIADRPGGYTRIIKMGTRQGDNAEMALIELVDYNELLLGASDDSSAKSKTRRSRRKSSKSSTDQTSASKTESTPVESAIESTEEAAVVEETIEEQVDSVSAEAAEEVEENVVTETENSAKEQEESKEETSNSEDEEKKD